MSNINRNQLDTVAGSFENPLPQTNPIMKSDPCEEIFSSSDEDEQFNLASDALALLQSVL